MRRPGIFALVIAIAALAGAGIANDGVASMHGQTAETSGEGGSIMGTGMMDQGMLSMPAMDPARGRMK